jgi:hypothetical protein
MITFSASAQFSVGVKGGLNLATLGGDGESPDMRASFHVGGYLNFPLSDNLSIQPELLYNSVGAKNSESDSYEEDGFEITEKVDVVFKLNYVSIPLMMKYSFGAINLQAGPQLSILAKAKSKIEYEIVVDGDLEESGSVEDDVDDIKGFDVGLNVGLGADVGKLNATVRYSLGLANINDDSDFKTTNNVIQISVGYKIFDGKD